MHTQGPEDAQECGFASQSDGKVGLTAQVEKAQMLKFPGIDSYALTFCSIPGLCLDIKQFNRSSLYFALVHGCQGFLEFKNFSFFFGIIFVLLE